MTDRCFLLPSCVRLIGKQYIVLNVILLVLALGFACVDCICVRKDKPTWRPESCLWEKSKPFWSLEKRGNWVIAQAMGIACTTTWNVLKKKETAGVLSNRHRTGRPRKTTAVDDRNIVRAVKKNPKTSVSDITNNLHRTGVKVSQSTVQRRLREQQYRGYTTRCKPLISSKNRKARLNLQRSTEMSHKSSGTKFYGLMRLILTSTNVMERPECGERRDLSWSKTYKLICEARWRKCHGLAATLLEWAQ